MFGNVSLPRLLIQLFDTYCILVKDGHAAPGWQLTHPPPSNPTARFECNCWKEFQRTLSAVEHLPSPAFHPNHARFLRLALFFLPLPLGPRRRAGANGHGQRRGPEHAVVVAAVPAAGRQPGHPATLQRAGLLAQAQRALRLPHRCACGWARGAVVNGWDEPQGGVIDHGSRRAATRSRGIIATISIELVLIGWRRRLIRFVYDVPILGAIGDIIDYCAAGCHCIIPICPRERYLRSRYRM